MQRTKNLTKRAGGATRRAAGTDGDTAYSVGGGRGSEVVDGRTREGMRCYAEGHGILSVRVGGRHGVGRC